MIDERISIFDHISFLNNEYLITRNIKMTWLILLLCNIDIHVVYRTNFGVFVHPIYSRTIQLNVL